MRSNEGEQQGETPAGDLVGGNAAGLARSDAIAALQDLGDRAFVEVPNRVQKKIYQWLGKPQWIFAGTRIDPAGQIETADGDWLNDRISVADDLMMMANIIDHGKADFVLHQALVGPRMPAGPNFTTAAENAPSLNDAISVYSMALTMRNPHLGAELSLASDVASFEILEKVKLGRVGIFLSIFALIIAYRTIVLFSPSALHRISVFISHPRLQKFGGAADELPGQFFYDQPGNRILFPQQLLRTANVDNDPNLWRITQERYKLFDSDSVSANSVRSIVRHMLATEGRIARQEDVAGKLGVSERTLVRKLATASTSYQKIVDAERRNLALQLLEDRALKMDSVANRLGFSSSASFSRAFKVWFGIPPSRYRNSSKLR